MVANLTRYIPQTNFEKFMAETWGSLAKDQSTSTTIDQAIASAISAHEADPTAHLGAGESLQSHKANEVIDHPALSVVDDKVRIDKYSILTNFESIDGLDHSASVFSYIGYLEISTTVSLNDFQYAILPSDDQFGFAPDISQNPIFEALVAVSFSHDFVASLGVCNPEDSGAGFKFTPSGVVAYWFDSDNVEHTISISGVANIQILHKYRIEIVDGVSVTWYVDNVSVATLSLVSNDLAITTGRIFNFQIENLEAGYVSKIMAFRAKYEQDI